MKGKKGKRRLCERNTVCQNAHRLFLLFLFLFLSAKAGAVRTRDRTNSASEKRKGEKSLQGSEGGEDGNSGRKKWEMKGRWSSLLIVVVGRPPSNEGEGQTSWDLQERAHKDPSPPFPFLSPKDWSCACGLVLSKELFLRSCKRPLPFSPTAEGPIPSWEGS